MKLISILYCLCVCRFVGRKGNYCWRWGVAGLLAARVLSSHFEQVIVLEKDVYPEKAMPRNGIPQSHHIHILLMKGKQIFTELFPNLESVLISKGAHKVDLLADVKYHLATGFYASKIGYVYYCMYKTTLGKLYKT